MVGEERARQQHVHRQPRGARRERDQQACQQTWAGLRQDSGGREGGQVAAEPHDQRKQRASVKAKGTHCAVGDEGGAGQIPRVLEDSEGANMIAMMGRNVGPRACLLNLCV